MKPLYPGYSGIGDRLKVGVDAFLRDVPSDEMEPGFRIEHFLRLFECGFVGRTESSPEGLGIRDDTRDRRLALIVRSACRLPPDSYPCQG